MNAALTVTDPLAEEEVSIVITLTADKRPRDERPALVSIGIAGQAPIIKSGVFGATMELIEEAWTAFGVRAQLATAAATDDTSVDTMSAAATDETTTKEVVTESAVTEETIAETAVVERVAPAASPPSRLAAKPTVPKPTASNLSLF